MFAGGLSRFRNREDPDDYTDYEDGSADGGTVVLGSHNPFGEASPPHRSHGASHPPHRSSGRAATRYHDEEDEELGVTVLSENPFHQHHDSGHRSHSPQRASQPRRVRSTLFSDPSSEEAPQERASGHRSTHRREQTPSPPPRARARTGQPNQVSGVSTSQANSRFGASFIRPVDRNIEIGTGNETDPLVVQWVDDPDQVDEDEEEEEAQHHHHTPAHGHS